MSCDVFMSYTSVKDLFGVVGEFRDHLENELRKTTGNVSLTVFQDKREFHGGDKWQEILSAELASAKLLLILLSPQLMHGFEDTVVEGASALIVRSDVSPGQNYVFTFHLRAPANEGSYYYRWRLVHAGPPTKELLEIGSVAPRQSGRSPHTDLHVPTSAAKRQPSRTKLLLFQKSLNL